jgi:hypothetical protein
MLAGIVLAAALVLSSNIIMDKNAYLNEVIEVEIDITCPLDCYQHELSDSDALAIKLAHSYYETLSNQSM